MSITDTYKLSIAGSVIDSRLADVPNKATASALTAETTRATAAEATLRNSVTALDTNGNSGYVNALTASSDGSTVTITAGKKNISTGATTTADTALPVASASAAGVMNAATYTALQSAVALINALADAAVAVSNLPSSPTQAELTAAWKTATGMTSLINMATIGDVTNSKIWTYYDNTSTWYGVATGVISISTWTNSSLGIAKGSTVDGQIYAENDGTGSVNGWDTLKTRVSTLESGTLKTSDASTVMSVTFADETTATYKLLDNA